MNRLSCRELGHRAALSLSEFARCRLRLVIALGWSWREGRSLTSRPELAPVGPHRFRLANHRGVEVGCVRGGCVKNDRGQSFRLKDEQLQARRPQNRSHQD